MNQAMSILQLQAMVEVLPDNEKDFFFQSYINQIKNPALAVGLSVCLGTFGIDRFYAGDVLLGILKLITLGGMGIWHIVDIFLIGGRVRTKNMRIAQEIMMSLR